MGDSRGNASEVRCVAPLVTLGPKPKLVGPVTIVTNGDRAIAFTSAERLRTAAEPLVIYTRLDGSSSIPVKAWQLGLRTGIGIIEIPPGSSFSTEVHPLFFSSIYATPDPRGAPSGIVTFDASFKRRVINVHVDNADPSGDDPLWLASPMSADGEGVDVDGSPLFAWLPPDPVLGRPSEVVVVACGVTYLSGVLRPRPRAPLAELLGLDDLARVLPWADQTPPPRGELGQVAGEIDKPK
jgi:hypothetical protein